MSNLTNAVNELKPFRFWCQHVLPLVYDDSLSYYELLNKVVNYLNEMADKISLIDPFVGEITKEMEELKEYVDNWIESAHLDEEIDAYIDAKFASQEFTTRLTQIVSAEVTSQTAELASTVANHTADLNKIKPQLSAVAKNMFNYGKALFIGDSWGAAWNAPEGTANTSFEDIIAQDLGISNYYRKDEGGAGFAYGNGHWYGKLLSDFVAEHPTEPNNITNIFIIGGQNDLNDNTDYVYSNTQYECKWVANYINEHFPNAKVWVGMVARTSGWNTDASYGNINRTTNYYIEACRHYNWNYITKSELMVHNYNMIAPNDGKHLTHSAYITLGHYLAESIKNGYWRQHPQGFTGLAMSSDYDASTYISSVPVNLGINQYLSDSGVTLLIETPQFISIPNKNLVANTTYILCEYGSNYTNPNTSPKNFFNSLYRIRIPLEILITFTPQGASNATTQLVFGDLLFNEDGKMRIRLQRTNEGGTSWPTFTNVTQMIVTPFTFVIPPELC